MSVVLNDCQVFCFPMFPRIEIDEKSFRTNSNVCSESSLTKLNNFVDRFTAKEFLLASRRPLLLEKSGLDIWSKLFTVLAWSSILSNAILLAWNTRIATRYVYLKTHKNMTNFLAFNISPFATSSYTKMYWLQKSFEEYAGFKPDVCYFTGSILTVEKYNSLVQNGPYFLYQPGFVLSPEHYEINRHSYMVLILFHYLGLIAILLVQYLIPPSPLDIEDSIKTEQNIKDAFLTQSQQ